MGRRWEPRPEFLRIMKAGDLDEAPAPGTPEARLVRQARENVLSPEPRLPRHVERIRGW